MVTMATNKWLGWQQERYVYFTILAYYKGGTHILSY